MIDRADEIAREIADAHLAGNDSQIDAIVEDTAAALRSYAAAIEAKLTAWQKQASLMEAARDRSEDRARQSEAELVAMREERDRLREVLEEASSALEPFDHSSDTFLDWDDNGHVISLTYVRDFHRASLVRSRARAALSPPTPEGGGG